MLASLLEWALSAEAGDSHVCWFVGFHQLLHSAGVGFNESIMERFWLVELLPVLSSLLVGPNIFLRRPRGRVPQLIADYIPRAIVD